MTLEVQEHVVLELLFDAGLRAELARDGVHALARYGLSESELADFAAIDPFGLESDARMRRELLLHRLARAFPLLFSICSSRPASLDALRALVDVDHVRTPAGIRTARFGERARDALVELPFADARERALCAAIADAEVSFAAAQASARESAIAGELAVDTPVALAPDWTARPLRFAPALSCVVLPRSYAELKKLLCPCAPEELWARLTSAPLPAARLHDVLAVERPRLVVSRAVVMRVSPCEATVTQQWLELSHGFVPLLRHIDDKTSAEQLLARFARAGAKPELVESVRQGLRQLLEQGMLRAL